MIVVLLPSVDAHAARVRGRLGPWRPRGLDVTGERPWRGHRRSRSRSRSVVGVSIAGGVGQPRGERRFHPREPKRRSGRAALGGDGPHPLLGTRRLVLVRTPGRHRRRRRVVLVPLRLPVRPMGRLQLPRVVARCRTVAATATIVAPVGRCDPPLLLLLLLLVVVVVVVVPSTAATCVGHQTATGREY